MRLLLPDVLHKAVLHNLVNLMFLYRLMIIHFLIFPLILRLCVILIQLLLLLIIRVIYALAVPLARFNAEDSSAKITTQGKKNADVNASGTPDKNDTVKILKFIAKLIPYESLGTEKDN